MLLTRMRDLSIETRIRSLSWWLGRVLLLEQRILDGRSSSLFDLLHVYLGEALQQFGTSEQVQSYWDTNLRDGESLAIVSLLHLEAGIMEYAYGRVDSCRSVTLGDSFLLIYSLTWLSAVVLSVLFCLECEMEVHFSKYYLLLMRLSSACFMYLCIAR